jgi:hypothetical protein
MGLDGARSNTNLNAIILQHSHKYASVFVSDKSYSLVGYWVRPGAISTTTVNAIILHLSYKQARVFVSDKSYSLAGYFWVKLAIRSIV